MSLRIRSECSAHEARMNMNEGFVTLCEQRCRCRSLVGARPEQPRRVCKPASCQQRCRSVFRASAAQPRRVWKRGRTAILTFPGGWGRRGAARRSEAEGALARLGRPGRRLGTLWPSWLPWRRPGPPLPPWLRLWRALAALARPCLAGTQQLHTQSHTSCILSCILSCIPSCIPHSYAG